mmetsp:Transcript_54366/g.156320  ORF Transcript_54366/g.156320 Transcript_54366/m.156320 type:complete len:453 (+) Transcript_54366:50-1408(+)
MASEEPIVAASAPVSASAPSGLRPAAKLLQRGVHVVLRDMEATQKVFWLGQGCKDLRMGRYPPIPIEAVLDQPYGAILRRSEGGQWLRYRRTCEEQPPPPAGGDEGGEEEYVSNALLAQDNSAQALSPGEVSELKGRCSGDEVVAAIASNSATFATKTKFAQEKYLRKKEQKHVQQVTLLRATLFELCDTYMKASRNKVCGLRFDMLSSILCQADVQTGGRFLVLDSACGLVVAAMAQQLCGSGQVFRMYRGGCPEKALVELDLGERCSVVRPLPLEVLQSDDPWSLEWLRQPEPTTTGEASEELLASKLVSRQERFRSRSADLRGLQARPVDSLIIVAGDEESDLASEALEVGLSHLAPGGRLVVFGQHLQPLAARQGVFRTSGAFVDVKLNQLFTREYQVLPQRTHPIMTAEAMLCEGFLLTATKVTNEERASGGDAAVDEAPRKKRQRS